MTKYKLEDLKVGAVFKNGNEIRTIIRVGKTMAIYSFGGLGNFVSIDLFLSGQYGKLIVPAIKTKKIKTKKRNFSVGNASIGEGPKNKK